MTKDHRNFLTTHPGRESAGGVTHRRAFCAEPNSQDYGFPTNPISEAFSTVHCGYISTNGGGPLATATAAVGNFSVTILSTGATANGLDGFTMTTAATSADRVVLRHQRRFKAGGVGSLGMSRFLGQVAAITASSIYLGFFNLQVDPIGTPPTNGVWFTIVNGALVGNVRGASGTLATVALGSVVAATAFEIDVKFANAVTSGGTTSSSGEWWFNGVRTPFSAAQMTQLAACTGDLYHHIVLQATTTVAQVLTVDQAWANYDR